MMPKGFKEPQVPGAYDIPSSLISCDNWIETQLNRGAAPNWSKHKDWKPKPFGQALKDATESQYVGMVFRKSHSYIIIDLDVESGDSHKGSMKTLTPQAIELIEAYPTYIEKSKSGKGLHLHYEVEDKDEWPFNIKKVKTEFTGEIYVKKGFVIFTNNPHPDISIPTVAKVSFKDIAELIPSITSAEIIEAPIEYKHEQPSGFQYGLKDLTIMLNQLTPWPSPQIKRAYEGFEGQPYDNYDFWNKIICSVKDYCTRNNISGTEGLGLLDIWSSKDISGSYDERDSAGLTGYDAVKAKWDSYDLAKDSSYISYKTVQMYAELGKLNWPHMDTKGRVIKHYDNYVELVEHHNISFSQNSYMEGHFRVNGDTDPIIRNWTRQGAPDNTLFSTAELELFNYKFCQREFPSAPPVDIRLTTTFFKTYMNDNWNLYNPVEEWIKSEPYAGISYEKQFFSIFTFQQAYKQYAEFYCSVIKKTCMQLLKSFIYEGPFQQDTLMPILQGPEATHKSTFIRLLLGPELSKTYFGVISEGVTSRFNRKDIELKLIRYGVVEIEEIDNQLRGDKSSALKAMISNDKIYVRVPYGRQTKIYPRRCLLFGSSNSDTFNLSRFGNRRTPIIPISFIDTDALLSLPMQQIWAQWLDELRRELARDKVSTKYWTLTGEEEATANRVSSNFFAGNEVDYILDDMFKWNHPFTSDYVTRTTNCKHNPNPQIFFSLKELTSLVQEYVGIGKSIKAGAIRHAIKQRTSEWTDTVKKPREMGRPVTGFIENGVFHYRDRKLYLVPPRTTPFSGEE